MNYKSLSIVMENLLFRDFDIEQFHQKVFRVIPLGVVLQRLFQERSKVSKGAVPQLKWEGECSQVTFASLSISTGK